MFASEDVKCLKSGVDYLWIIVMFLSAVWTLILTAPHSLQRIHWWTSDVMIQFFLSKYVPMKKQLIIILDGLRGEYIIGKFSFSDETISLI